MRRRNGSGVLTRGHGEEIWRTMMANKSLEKSGFIRLTLSSDELAILNNCLNEALNGFVVHNLEQTLGASREHSAKLLSAVHRAAEAGAVQTLELKKFELDVFSRAVRVTINELGPEFSTRSGFTAEEADTLASHIETL